MPTQSSTICAVVKPYASITASVQPSCATMRAIRARARRSGRGPVAHMAKRRECGMGEREHARVYPNAHSNAARKQDERARWSAVVPLALEKRLFLNASCRCLLVPLLGKKYCDINKRLD